MWFSLHCQKNELCLKDKQQAQAVGLERGRANTQTIFVLSCDWPVSYVWWFLQYPKSATFMLRKLQFCFSFHVPDSMGGIMTSLRADRSLAW
jgi:hypothetical protein